MSEQITWTHVDKLVRKMHDDRGMLPLGLTDAEVAHAFIGWLQRENETLRAAGASLESKLAWTETSLRAAQNRPVKKSKTKERLAKLEAAVAELQKPPAHNFVPAFVEGLVRARCCERFPKCVCYEGADGL